ncbi:MAG TPA: periplasmic heavy metal sensor, partial [Desulfobacteraceae bacterium]|nr:periplasmic heavy metal sensor [Desulfobacteraceae bacterium]
MKKGKILLAGLAIAMTFTASQGFAWMRGPMTGGRMMNGQMMGGTYNSGLNAGQQKKVMEIEARYQKQFADQEAAIQAKAAELRAALADGTSTLNKINGLRNQLFALEQGYGQLRNQVRQGIGRDIDVAYTGAMGWRPADCDWHDHGSMSG